MKESNLSKLSLKTLIASEYGWPLHQLRIPEAHKISRGSPNIIVAVIDLGFRMHPELKAHLWENPKPTKGDIYGWDFVDNDNTLEYTGWQSDTTYHTSHHTFIVGEVAAVAPECPIMVLRVATNHKRSWHEAINYAVDYGAKVLVIPHGYMNEGENSVPIFYQGTDFSYPEDNPGLKKTLDNAYSAGCLIFKGTADNRGRRVATAMSAIDSVISVGSTNRKGEAADIACSSDYVEVSAPGGERKSKNELDKVWSTGGEKNFIPFTGGCMASGFAGGVGALVMSRFPNLSNEKIRQIMRNTAQGKGWDPYLGHGILDAEKALSIKNESITQRLKVKPESGKIIFQDGKYVLQIDIANQGVLDAKKVLVVAYNGNPQKPAKSSATRDNPVILLTRQIGHTVVSIPGLESITAHIELTEKPKIEKTYVQTFTIDKESEEICDTAKIIFKNHSS